LAEETPHFTRQDQSNYALKRIKSQRKIRHFSRTGK